MNKFPIKVIVYTLCYNELAILPFIIDYWKRYATKVIVYDNGSTDGSDLFLKKFDFIEVRKYNTKDKFVPGAIQEFKNTVWKECKGKNIDFVQVCDIDEVLFDTADTNIMRKLIDIKNSNSTVVLSNYYEVICDKIPNYDGQLLAHEYPNAGNYIQNTIKKPIIFKPDCIANIKFSYDCRSAQPAGKIVYAKNGIDTLHLKMFGATNYIEHNMEILSRCSDKNYGPYGRTPGQMGMIMANVKNSNPVISNAINKITQNNVKFDNFNDIEWTDASVKVGSNHIDNQECVIAIPVYKSCVIRDELYSIKQLIKILGGKYNICLVCPNGLYTEYYRYICNYDFDVLYCNPNYFKGQNTYSWMCENWKFYDCFSEYKYMLLYQPDGWIFYDNLDYFLKSDFDYIGGPWKSGYVTSDAQESVGNGGVSLRKIDKFVRVLKDYTADYDVYPKKHIDFEDLLFCVSMKDKFHISDVVTGYLFGFDANPDYWWERSEHKMPMFAHGWKKHNYQDFWIKKIINGKIYSNPYINQECNKEEYMYDTDSSETTFGTSDTCADNTEVDVATVENTQPENAVIDNNSLIESDETLDNIFDEMDNAVEAEELVVEESKIEQSEPNSKVIYTCITGGYDTLKEPLETSKGFDYICFTDNMSITSEHWQIRPIPDELKNLDNIRKQRYIKINPHKYLSDYELSVWVDGSIEIKADINPLVDSIDWNREYIAIPQHPIRNCIYRECEECIKLKKDNSNIMKKLISIYKKLGYPMNQGLVLSNIIIRKHNNENCKQLMILWSHEILTKSYRDQLSFNFCVWRLNANIHLLDKYIYKSKYFLWNTKHQNIIKIGIVHYNTPKLLDCLIKSIHKHTKNVLIYIFDNSDKLPFINTYNNVTVFNNTKGQIINFEKWLEQYPNRFKSSEATHIFGSAKHSISIQKMLELINDNFILMDSDILLKKDISDIVDNEYIYVGESTLQPKVTNIYRVLPFICFLNVKMMKQLGITYFNDKYMHGLKVTTQGDMYDTGGALYMATRHLKYKEIKIENYITHYKGGSWEHTHKQRYNITLTSDEWLEQNKNLWE